MKPTDSERSRLDNRSVVAVLQDIASQVEASNRAEEHGRVQLWGALATALDLYRLIQCSAAHESEFENELRVHNIRTRKDAHPLTPLAKLCFPGRKARDYHRYAGALGFAINEDWDGARFRAELAKRGNGGLTALAKLDPMEPPSPQSPRHLDYALHNLGRTWMRRNEIATIKLDESNDKEALKRGAVLLLANRINSKTIEVYRILDGGISRKIAEKMFRKELRGRKCKPKLVMRK